MPNAPGPRPLRIAIVGSGIAGLSVAHRLRGKADISLLEAGSYFGGHAHTVDVSLDGIRHGVDTGFLVYNERTYPLLIDLFKQLQVKVAKSDMSFSVQVPGARKGQALEWSGSNLSTVFAQRGNLLNWRFLSMLRDLLRFNAMATHMAQVGHAAQLTQSLGAFLDQHRFGAAFRDWYLLPMVGCIWSCPTEQMLQFPVATMVRFCHNHGLLQVAQRPQWYTVQDGSRNYVEKIIGGIADKRLNTPVERVQRVHDAQGAGVMVFSQGHAERFDHVVLATHAPQSLAMLADASPAERKVLGAMQTQANRAVLHTDTRVLPQNRAAWAAWNYERAAPSGNRSASTPCSPSAPSQHSNSQVCLHYLLNLLQPLPFKRSVLVSLNPVRAIDPAQVLAEFDYAHPVFDAAALQAQQALPTLQGQGNTWFCGAWTGYGFHEDGLRSGLEVAQALSKAAVAQERV